MKKQFWLIFLFIFCVGIANADDKKLIEENSIQTRINNIGTSILNANKIDERVIFVYNEKEKANLLEMNDSVTKRQVVVFSDTYKNIETDDELAGYIAREIPAATRSYEGLGKGLFSTLKMKAAPKKYELVFDKLAVDYMVKAGYNPLGLITYINKTYPQTRQDKLSTRNLTSRRLAYIYERIYQNYPSFLIDNAYLENKYYQNFLLNSRKNRENTAEITKNPELARKLKYE